MSTAEIAAAPEPIVIEDANGIRHILAIKNSTSGPVIIEQLWEDGQPTKYEVIRIPGKHLPAFIAQLQALR